MLCYVRSHQARGPGEFGRTMAVAVDKPVVVAVMLDHCCCCCYVTTHTCAPPTLRCTQGFFGSLRLELADRGIKVTMVCPGPVLTDGQANAASGKAGQVVGKVLYTQTALLALPCLCVC